MIEKKQYNRSESSASLEHPDIPVKVHFGMCEDVMLTQYTNIVLTLHRMDAQLV